VSSSGAIIAAMELARDLSGEPNAIVACGHNEVRLRDRAFGSSVIVTRSRVIDGWRPASPDALTIGDFGELLDLEPEVVLLGTGDRQRLPSPALYAEFAARGIGLEVMDNRAACRTYNVLLSELREVAVALML
jgi:uncharacterized protein